MTTEHVIVPRELAEACEIALRERGYLGDANDMQAILSRATPSDADLKKWLADPETVLVWMLRGIIAVPSHKAMADRFWNGEFSDEKDKPSAPRVVTDTSVQIAQRIHSDSFANGMSQDESWRAALESFATSMPAAIPPGYVVVPIEPTHEMCGAPDAVWHPEARKIYQQMLAAAPQAEGKG